MPEASLHPHGFLGPTFSEVTKTARIAVIGISGGGSHVVQQLAHAGFTQFVLYDPDRIEEHNLSRHVGATTADVAANRLKVDIGTRVIRSVQPGADVEVHACTWEDAPAPLRRCDLIFACIDTFRGREQIDTFGRRFLIPVIDMGLDIHPPVGGEPPRMAGQVVLSMPGQACLRCLSVITERNISAEARRYGDVGHRPQVVWANGVLASAAIGMAVDLLVGWSGQVPVWFQAFDGNRLEARDDVRWTLRPTSCPHYPIEIVGLPSMRPLSSGRMT